MREMREELLHFFWQHGMRREQEHYSTTNKKIRIIHPGMPNPNAGPDFFNACIEVEGVILRGNVEIHLKSSDWLRHGHQHDENYDRIILHVVYIADVELEQNNRFGVEVLELQADLPLQLQEKYRTLMEEKKGIPCKGAFASVQDIVVGSWLERMLIERLETKLQYTEELSRGFKGDHLQTFYALCLRSFGSQVNAFPFEMLARSVPYKILFALQGSLLQTEALLFGAAGFLDEVFKHTYGQTLQNEFEYLKRKYRIIPMNKNIFKFSRMRPDNFPTLRMAQFASFFHHSADIFSDPSRFKDALFLKEKLTLCPLSTHWKHHYSLTDSETKKKGGLGGDSAESVIINAFVHFQFYHGTKIGRGAEDALELLRNCAAEENMKTRCFAERSELVKDAGAGQALIHLHDHYCSARQCTRCAIGVVLLKNAESTGQERRLNSTLYTTNET